MEKVALIKDINTGWWKKFSAALTKNGVSCKPIDVEHNDWLEQIGPVEHVLWRPNLVEPYLRQSTEKLFLLENILGKKVYPNQKTFWHYNNKNAESYLAKVKGIKMPERFVSYSYEDTLQYLQRCRYPLVSKTAGGAGSRNVRLLKDFSTAKKELDYLFNKDFKNRSINKILKNCGLRHTKYDMQRYYVHYQEFVPGNVRDFRVTTIGNKYVFAFFRRNRKNDFRASGSGLIEYDRTDHNFAVMQYCLDVSRENGFDTMCYDILYTDKQFVSVEFSYIFNDKAIYDCPGHYELQNGNLKFVDGNVWPQELIVEYLVKKWSLSSDKSLVH